MGAPTVDFYTFVKDPRAGGGGSAVSYHYDVTAGDLTSVGDLLQGEFVEWGSTTASVIRFVRTDAHAYIGISRESAKSVHKLGNQSALGVTELSVFTTGVHNMRSTNGETYVEGQPVYMNGTNTDQITNVAGGGIQVGQVYLPNGPATIVGDGTNRVPIIIDEYTNYSGDAGV